VSRRQFIMAKIAEIVRQIEWPRTNRPEEEVQELHAEMVFWWGELRMVDPR
jgi:hypothetical protein